jgi:stearoyl-CoA desaturase (delta-9 desaturase)
MNSLVTTAQPVSRFRLNWLQIAWIGLIHAGVILAPFTFSWSALVVCVVLYLLTGFGVTMGYHRLLTHRSFRTPKFMEYFLTLLGGLANQGGPLQWVATHRAHHAHSDEEGDPHSPRDGGWWAHMFWWMCFDPVLDDPARRRLYVKDLDKDRVHRFLDRYQIVLPLSLTVVLFILGEVWGGVGLPWVIWGICVRTTLLYHLTWLVNSATHMWGYQSYETGDRSTNLWWVALLSLGEGWHNNHHAFQRSARHGLRWWEVDFTYYLIKLCGFVGLARSIQKPRRSTILARRSLGPAHHSASQWTELGASAVARQSLNIH